MSRTSSHRYKQNSRQQRKTVNENAFTGGMNFTTNPLPMGQVKLLVNIIQKDFGNRLKPRGGWHQIATPKSLGVDMLNPYIHHEGTTFVKDTRDDSVSLKRYALILDYQEEGANYGVSNFSRLILEEETEENPVFIPPDPTQPQPLPVPPEHMREGHLVVATIVSNTNGERPLLKHNPWSELTTLHGEKVHRAEPTGLAASIEGNTYLLGQSHMYRLEVMYNGTIYTYRFERVAPLEVTPTQAVNYGYNMLLPAPYHFPNKQMANFRGLGILPYDPVTGTIKMQAKVGESVQFRLIYEYKSGEQYKVQWEVQDIYKRDGVNVIQKKEDSPTYTNGQAIFLDYAPMFKQFSVVATVYLASNLNNPIRTVILAAYHLADDSNNVRMEQKRYSLLSAKGITVWKNQMVYHGVREAEMSVFISDINDPTYVPFPNHTLIFNEKVINAFPYMESLMVVTEHTMYQVDFDMEDGFTQRPVQTNLQLRDDDAMAMFSVRNLVIFKSRDYYYMVVPNTKNDRGELQIAPISANITYFLDNFKQSTREVLSEVYTLRQLLDEPDDNIELKLQDFKGYQDGNRIRLAYKWHIETPNQDLYIEVHLIYDSVFRAWTIEVVETGRRPLKVFQSISTGYAQFFNLVRAWNSNFNKTETFLQWIGIKEELPHDHFNLDFFEPRTIQNFQMLDTGLRDLEGTKGKRMRQTILEFNNLSDEDIEFNHALYVDDSVRSDLFKFNVVHIVDPTDPEYGRIYVEREFVDPTTIHGVTKLNTWSLGNSQFPKQTTIKAFLNWTGKGYYPRLRLITRTHKPYELNQITWVYRDMNARSGMFIKLSGNDIIPTER